MYDMAHALLSTPHGDRLLACFASAAPSSIALACMHRAWLTQIIRVLYHVDVYYPELFPQFVAAIRTALPVLTITPSMQGATDALSAYIEVEGAAGRGTVALQLVLGAMLQTHRDILALSMEPHAIAPILSATHAKWVVEPLVEFFLPSIHGDMNVLHAHLQTLYHIP